MKDGGKVGAPQLAEARRLHSSRMAGFYPHFKLVLEKCAVYKLEVIFTVVAAMLTI